jgi:hypothetical protein
VIRPEERSDTDQRDSNALLPEVHQRAMEDLVVGMREDDEQRWATRWSGLRDRAGRPAV